MKAHNFILYISGNSPISIAAESNLRAICEEYLAGEFEIKLVDILISIDEAEEAGILAIPTLVRISPFPKLRIIGALNMKSRVLTGLGIVSNK